MHYLLDTDVLLWWLDNDKRLKDSIKQIINDRENRIYVSVVSGIEISIKHKLGKLPLKTTVRRIFEIADLDILNINLDHVLEFNKLPLSKKHKDPFDRILIAQAKVEWLTLVTSDPKIWKYKVSLFRA